jgi:4-carboxymuconolactone decarboxylase
MSKHPAPRIDPVLPPAWVGEIHEALGAFPKGRDFVLGRWQAGSDMRGMHLLGALARHPALAKAFLTFNAHAAAAGGLTAREREILILRISWLCRSEYELVQHLILGRRAGLGEAELERIQQGPEAEGWSEADADLLRAADELYARQCIAEATWQRLAGRYDTAKLMDLVFVIGCYQTIAMAANSFGVQLEPGVAGLEPAMAARLHAQAG